MKSHIKLLVVSLCLTGGTLAHAQEVALTLSAAPKMDVGDKWTYTVENWRNDREKRVYSEQVYRLVGDDVWMLWERPKSKFKQIIRWNAADARPSMIYDYVAAKTDFLGERQLDYSERKELQQFPLSVGRQYEVQYRTQAESSKSIILHTYNVTIKDYERVHTSAGDFHAYKLVGKGKWTCETGCSVSGEQKMTVWWSPEVKRTVKSEYILYSDSGKFANQITSELTQWQPKAALSPAVR